MTWKRRQPESPTKDAETYAYYLRDLGYLLREAAERTVKEVASARGDSKIFEEGRQMGYIEVLSTMQNQADSFEIPLSQLCLDGLDPDNDFFRRTDS